MKTKEEQTALAKRAVASSHWSWLPGMEGLLPDRHCRIANDKAPYWGGARQGNRASPDLLPNLTDPATLGCLLALVRAAWSDPEAHLALGAAGWVLLSGESRGVETVYPVPAGQTEAEVLVAALEITPEARWPYERAVKVFNEHCPQVCDLFREKFSTQAEYNAAYREEMNKRLAHTGWTEAQITARIFDQAAAGMEAYYTPMRSKP